MNAIRNVPVRAETQRRLKMEAAYQGRSIIDLATEILERYICECEASHANAHRAEVITMRPQQ